MNLRPLIAAITAAVVVACNRSGSGATLRSTGRDTAAASGMTLGIDTVARGLEVPWGMAFAPDGRILVTGDDAPLAGKILRAQRDGSPAPGNPRPGSLVYARGVRNPQGLTWDPASGQAFATDHGPSGFPNERFRRDRDELNVTTRDANLGWPTVSGAATDRRFTPPLVVWGSPGIAPSGAAFYTGPVPEWQRSVFVAALKGEQLRRVVVARDSASPAGWRALSDEPMFVKKFGRLRAVAMGPDGLLYFTTSNRDGRGAPRPGDDLLLRIRPR